MTRKSGFYLNVGEELQYEDSQSGYQNVDIMTTAQYTLRSSVKVVR